MEPSLFKIFIIFLRLGLTSFGGPIAHLGFFHQEFVNRRKWISNDHYLNLVSFCQILPGPASSQVGISIGLLKGGVPGSIAAWLGFTLPSFLLFVLFAFGVTHSTDFIRVGIFHGLKLAAVAIIAQAIYSMALKSCFEITRFSIGIFALILTSLLNNTAIQLIAIFLGAFLGTFFIKNDSFSPLQAIDAGISKMASFFSLGLFLFFLFTLPILNELTHLHFFQNLEQFYLIGSWTFGGGHAALPLLKTMFVNHDLISNELFMAGYGAAQAMPGPLYSFCAYLGALSPVTPNGVSGAIFSTVAVFLPSFLLVIGLLPFWTRWNHLPHLRRAFQGMNAATVGILAAVFYQPVLLSSIFGIKDAMIALIALLLLQFLKLPSWAIVILCAIAGAV